MLAALISAITLAGAAQPSVTPPAPQTYLVQVDVRRGGESLAQPAITLREGGEASMTVTGGYDMQVRVKPEPESPGRVTVQTDITLVRGELRRTIAMPAMSFPRGGSASVRVNETATGDGTSITVTASAVADPPAGR